MAACVVPLSGCFTDAGMLDDGGGLTQLFSVAAPASVSGSGDATGRSISGTVRSRGDYRLFEFGATAAGTSWNIDAAFGTGAFTVVLFDGDMNLLERASAINAQPLRHIMRRASERIYVGVTPAAGGVGGDFLLGVTYDSQQNASAPKGQVVWVNFGGAEGVRVHGRAGISFGAFNAAAIGPEFAGETAAIKRMIVEAIRADYAGFDVSLVSSDESPEPGEEHSVLHFGGSDSRLLGLADNVDRYNADASQTAMIYVESFSTFSGLGMYVEEIALMLGNTGSHEIGHLLGLYHTRNANDVMDTTGSAWDLTENQSFLRVELESSVFPAGMENSPMILADTVGVVEVAAAARPTAQELAPDDPEKLQRRQKLRQLLSAELRDRCGLCSDPDS